MKRTFKQALFALSLATAVVGNAQAAGSTQMAAGCGVGTMVFQDKEGLLYGLLAATTNGLTFATVSQTFGLLNCPAEASIKGKIASFIDFNKQQLAVEVAQGSGERLDALIEMFGVADRQAAADVLKANHAVIFSHISGVAIEAQIEKTLNIDLS